MAKYVKLTRAKEDKAKATVVQANWQVASVIEAIHGVRKRLEATNFFLKAHLSSEAYPVYEVLTVLAPPLRGIEKTIFYTNFLFLRKIWREFIYQIMMHWF